MNHKKKKRAKPSNKKKKKKKKKKRESTYRVLHKINKEDIVKINIYNLVKARQTYIHTHTHTKVSVLCVCFKLLHSPSLS